MEQGAVWPPAEYFQWMLATALRQEHQENANRRNNTHKSQCENLRRNIRDAGSKLIDAPEAHGQQKQPQQYFVNEPNENHRQDSTLYILR